MMTFNEFCGIATAIWLALLVGLWLTWRRPPKRRRYRDEHENAGVG